MPTNPDPLENFGEQQRSHELLEEHGKALVADAEEILREEPEAEVVGLIVDGDAAEAASLRTALQQATGQDLGGRGFVGVAPREFVLQILRANAPSALDWLPSSTVEGRRMLPLMAITKGGVRFGAVPYPES